jgi:hypothetical protein
MRRLVGGSSVCSTLTASLEVFRGSKKVFPPPPCFRASPRSGFPRSSFLPRLPFFGEAPRLLKTWPWVGEQVVRRASLRNNHRGERGRRPPFFWSATSAACGLAYRKRERLRDNEDGQPVS